MYLYREMGSHALDQVERLTDSLRGDTMKLTVNLLCYSGLLVLVLFIYCMDANVAVAQEAGATSYLKRNIHYQQHSHDAKASYANWTDPGQGHMIMVVNKQIEFRTLKKRERSIQNASPRQDPLPVARRSMEVSARHRLLI